MVIEKNREQGMSLLEIVVSMVLLSVALLSISLVVFHLIRSNTDNRREYAAHSIVMNQLNVVKQESTSRATYLANYGGDGASFTPPAASVAGVFDSATGRVQAVPFDSPSNTAVVLRVELDYTDAAGTPRTNVVESLFRCAQP